MKVERVFLENNNNNLKNIIESILFDTLDNYFNEKYNFSKINNATSSERKEM